MGLIRNLANRKKEKNQGKKAAKAIATKALMIAIKKILIKIILISILIVVIGGIFTWLIELLTAEETPNTILEELEIETLNELVVIKGNESDGYHLEFVEDFDKKLDKLTQTLARREANRSFNEKDQTLLKNMFKAEMVTEFPDLGGKIEEDNENQFQGAITVRRVTPDKEIGEMKSTGAGEKTTAEDLKVDNTKEEEITYDKWQELKVRESTGVYLKGEYNFLGEKKSDNGITSKVSTMLSKIEGINRSITVSKGDTVYYTGNTFFYENNTYIEIAEQKEAEEVIGYVKNINVEIEKVTKNEPTEEENGENQGNKLPTKTIGDGSKEFVVAIAAGHNSSDNKGYSDGTWTEEKLTIEVAEQVETLLKDYTNIKVVQTGSTKEKDVKKEERTELAKAANPDLCIQIYFNSGEKQSGVEVCYESGDGKSEKLANVLSEKIADKMGLENRGAITYVGNSDFYDIIDSSMQTGFPSVITKGCFLDNKKDQEVLRNGGISQYAKGIVEACEDYLKNDQGDDTVTYIEQNDTYSRTRSRIHDLRYVTPETFEKYVSEANQEALEVYTLDENFNLVTAKWKIEEGVFSINKNSAMNFRTILQKVSMPYEYLLYFLIDSENKKFVRALANTVINDTEIIIAVQDNITTTEINTRVQQRTVITEDTGNEAPAEGWHDTSSEYKFNENCSTSIAITYANTWFMKFTKGNSYSSEALDVDKNEKVDIIKNVKGKVNETTIRTDEGWNNDNSGGVKIGGGIAYYETLKKGTTSKAEDASGNNVEKHKYSYEIYQRKEIITHTIFNQYEQGESTVQEEGNKFKKLYKGYKMANSVNMDWLTDIMANNERTANLVDLTKYMTFQSTKIDFGITDLDFSMFDLDALQNMGGIYGATIQEKVWWAILDAGYSKEAAAGVMGNIEAESGFNAGLIEHGSGIGGGLCQWSFGRRTQLEAYAASKGKEWTDENTQIEFLIGEITRGGGADGYATYQLVTYHGYSPTDWENATTPEDAAIAFCWSFERPGIPRMNVRTEAARKYYEEFKDKERSAAGSILQAADQVAQYVESNGYTYLNTGYANYTFPIANTPGRRTISCSSYIQEVLLQAGYTQCAGSEKLWARTNSALSKADFESMGIPVEIITDLNQIQPGDILQYTTGYHVVLAYSVSGDNIQIKGVPEVLSPSAGGPYSGYGAGGQTRTRSFLQGKGCYIVRIKT